MPKQTSPDDDQSMPTRDANEDPAEGSRETVDQTTGDEGGGGITNRPLAEQKDRLPPRGDSKEGGHA